MNYMFDSMHRVNFVMYAEFSRWMDYAVYTSRESWHFFSNCDVNFTFRAISNCDVDDTFRAILNINNTFRAIVMLMILLEHLAIHEKQAAQSH